MKRGGGGVMKHYRGLKGGRGRRRRMEKRCLLRGRTTMHWEATGIIIRHICPETRCIVGDVVQLPVLLFDELWSSSSREVTSDSRKEGEAPGQTPFSLPVGDVELDLDGTRYLLIVRRDVHHDTGLRDMENRGSELPVSLRLTSHMLGKKGQINGLDLKGFRDSAKVGLSSSLRHFTDLHSVMKNMDLEVFYSLFSPWTDGQILFHDVRGPGSFMELCF